MQGNQVPFIPTSPVVPISPVIPLSPVSTSLANTYVPSVSSPWTYPNSFVVPLPVADTSLRSRPSYHGSVPRRRTSKRQRSRSLLGGSTASPAFRQLDLPQFAVTGADSTYNRDHLSERPTTWRRYYYPPSKWIRRSLQLYAQLSLNLSLGEHKKLHYLLRFASSSVNSRPTISIDLRIPPSQPLPFQPAMNQTDLLQYATPFRPTSTLTLITPRLPWVIVVSSPPGQSTTGVTVADILAQLRREVHRPVDAADLWNVVMSPRDRERVQRACERRCRDVRLGAGSRVKRQVVKRVDFLDGKCVFVGLKAAKGGAWEIVLRNGA